MEEQNIKVAGMVVLYNPTDEDINNISTYIEDVDILYIIDNSEGKSNKNRIPQNKKIQYVFNNENVGVATALNVGAKKAISDGYKWLLTMDQDSSFKPNVIKKMKDVIISRDMSNVGIVTPWHNTKLIDKKPETEFDNPNDVMTSGNIINLDIYEKIGGFKDWLFIDGIDIEYCLNLHSQGYDILRINSIEIDHNLGDLFYKTRKNKLYLCTNHNAIRRYYIMRNYHYIFDLYHQYNLPYCCSLISQKHNMIGVLLFEKGKYKKIRNYLRGLRDYRKGIKGKYQYRN